MSSPEGDSAMPKVQETPSDTRSGAPVSYSFVNSDDKSRIRSHAMRASWRNRAASVPRRHRAREIAADESSSSRMEANPSRHGSRASSTEGPNAETADEEESEVFPRDGIYIDMRNTLTSPARRGLRGKKWRVSTRTYPHSRKQNPYRSIGEAEIDSFNSTQLSLEDQTLLHHWVNIYAHQAFGQPTDPTFGPLRDLYIPVNLAHEASVHVVLAHAAYHMAYLRQDRTESVSALAHKMVAIRLINEALNDPVKCVSGENLSAVMRLVTLERYWGTEDAWRLHRKGFIQLLKKRGGVPTCSRDWRLEMQVQLIVLIPRPHWNDPAFSASSQHNAASNLDNLTNNFERPHSDFLNFFDGVQIITNDTLDNYPSIRSAISYLRTPLSLAREETRLKCLFYLAIIFKDAHRSQFSLSWLNDSLAMTEPVWRNSLESLRWLLLQGMGRGPEDAEQMQRTERLAEVAALLKEYSWRSMEDRLLNILLGERVDEGGGMSWDSRLFPEQPPDI